MQNSHKLNWLDMNFEQVISGKTADNTRYLQLFLSDYYREFNNTTLNASCNKCIKDYLRKYKLKFNNMDNNCDYVLHSKRQGLQLEFGSSVFVNNINITNEYALRLIERYKKAKGDSFEMSFLFDKFPKEVKQKIVIESLEIDTTPIQQTEQSKKKRTRKTRK